MWTYEVETGQLFDDTGKLVDDACYSGHGPGINNPEMEQIRNVGPIPRGVWKIGKLQETSKLGPFAFRITPHEHSAFGRSGFWVHGDNAKGNKSASHGCIIARRSTRLRMARECTALLVK